MQQQSGYVPAVNAMNGNNRDWAGEITPPGRMHGALDTGYGGMSENGMGNGMEMRGGSMNSMNNMNGMGGMNNMNASRGTARNGMQGRDRQEVTLDMQNNLPDDVIESPTSNAEVYAGSAKAMLRRNLGNYVVATFLVGTQNTVSWEGILYDVGNDYVTIYQPGRDRYIVNDIYSLRYTEFYDVRRRQLCDRLMREQGWDVEENRSPFG